MIQEGKQMNILSLSGFIPEQICDTIRFFGYEGKQRISHYCRYASDYISQILEDPQIDGAVFPRTCDSSRIIQGLLGGYNRFLYSLSIPARRDGSAIPYLADSIRQYKIAVEHYYGIGLTDISERTKLINERNKTLRELYDHLPELSYGVYLDMIHGVLQKPLREQRVPAELPSCPYPDGPRAFVVGSTQTGSGIIRQIEAAGLHIVGDRLPESHRLSSAPDVMLEGDIFENIALSILSSMPSPSQDDFARILAKDKEELLRKQVQGVIFITQKYCEPYDYLFPAYQKMLDELGIRSLRVAVTGSQGEKEMSLAIGTFADML